MNILLINQTWFAGELKQFGHRVVSFGGDGAFDVVDRRSIIKWPEVLQQLPPDFQPELIIFHDNSGPINIFELEKIEVPTFFYSVDTHHHFNFHSQLGLFFSHIFLAQKDYSHHFQSLGVQPHWLPLWASAFLEPKQEKKHDAIFVGTLNPKLNPERVAFFEALQKKTELEVLTGGFAEIFPESRIIINQTVKRDLNFRVFEGMISGAMMLTERIENGLNELFVDGQHLVLYEKGNVDDAAQKISYYLADRKKAEKIGLAGRELICSRHLAVHRAEEMMSKINQPSRPTEYVNYHGLVSNYACYARLAASEGKKDLSKIFNYEALRLVRLGMQAGHELNYGLSSFVLMSLLGMSGIFSNQAIHDFLDELLERYPEQTIFGIAKIGISDIDGDTNLSRGLAAELNIDNAEDLISKSRQLVEYLTQFN